MKNKHTYTRVCLCRVYISIQGRITGQNLLFFYSDYSQSVRLFSALWHCEYRTQQNGCNLQNIVFYVNAEQTPLYILELALPDLDYNVLGTIS